MRPGTPVFDEDRLLVELAAKKIAVALRDFLSIGICACRYQVPSPKDYFAAHREVFQALAVTMRCVHGPTELAYVLSEIQDSSHQIATVLDQIIETFQGLVQWKEMDLSSFRSLIQRLGELITGTFTAISRHLSLVGSSETIDESIITTCKAILEAIPIELGVGKVGKVSETDS